MVLFEALFDVITYKRPTTEQHSAQSQLATLAFIEHPGNEKSEMFRTFSTVSPTMHTSVYTVQRSVTMVDKNYIDHMTNLAISYDSV